MGNLRNQNFWNFISALLFLGLAYVGIEIIEARFGYIPYSVSVLDIVLMVLAVFRLTRLFVYDKILEFVRDWFLDVKEEGGVIVRKKFDRGVKRAFSDLFDCPWCISIWVSLAVVFIYFLDPVFWYFILILAVSGASTFLQLLSNLIGWNAEDSKLNVHERKREF